MNEPLITWILSICPDEKNKAVDKKVLRYRRGQRGSPWKVLDFLYGKGIAADGNFKSYKDINLADRKNKNRIHRKRQKIQTRLPTRYNRRGWRVDLFGELRK